MGKPEAWIENYLRDECIKKGWMCLKFISQSLAGVPDRMIIAGKEAPGEKRIVCFVETKAPGEKPRKLQEAVIADMKRHGAYVFVADTRELVDSIVEWVEHMLK